MTIEQDTTITQESAFEQELDREQAASSREYERRWWTLGVLCISLVMIVMSNASLNVALPTLANDLHASSSSLQWIVDAYSLVFAGLLLTAGSLGDRYGRRLALNGGLIIFGGASFFAVLSSSSSAVIGARAVMGVGAAFVMPATLSILAHVFPPNERPRSIAGLATLVYGIIEAPDNGWASTQTIVTFAIAVAILGAFVWWEFRAKDPMLDLRFFKNPHFAAATTAITLVFFAMFGSYFL